MCFIDHKFVIVLQIILFVIFRYDITTNTNEAYNLVTRGGGGGGGGGGEEVEGNRGYNLHHSKWEGATKMHMKCLPPPTTAVQPGPERGQSSCWGSQ